MLYSVFKELFLTACAGAIMNEFEMRRKVRCHRSGLWKSAEVKAAQPSAWLLAEHQNLNRFGVVESHTSAPLRAGSFARNAKDGAFGSLR
jgi:hypothetical protein